MIFILDDFIYVFILLQIISILLFKLIIENIYYDSAATQLLNTINTELVIPVMKQKNYKVFKSESKN